MLQFSASILLQQVAQPVDKRVEGLVHDWVVTHSRLQTIETYIFVLSWSKGQQLFRWRLIGVWTVAGLWLQQIRLLSSKEIWNQMTNAYFMFLCFSVNFPGGEKGDAVHLLSTDKSHAPHLPCYLTFPIQELWPESRNNYLKGEILC